MNFCLPFPGQHFFWDIKNDPFPGHILTRNSRSRQLGICQAPRDSESWSDLTLPRSDLTRVCLECIALAVITDIIWTYIDSMALDYPTVLSVGYLQEHISANLLQKAQIPHYSKS